MPVRHEDADNITSPRSHTNGDGQISPAELAARGQSECDLLLQSVTLTVDAAAVPFTLAHSSFAYKDGQAGLVAHWYGYDLAILSLAGRSDSIISRSRRSASRQPRSCQKEPPEKTSIFDR